MFVGHVREPCKNGWTDRDTVWAGSCGPGNHVLDGVTIGQMYLHLEGVISRQCGLLSKFFDHLLLTICYYLLWRHLWRHEKSISEILIVRYFALFWNANWSSLVTVVWRHPRQLPGCQRPDITINHVGIPSTYHRWLWQTRDDRQLIVCVTFNIEDGNYPRAKAVFFLSLHRKSDWVF